MTNVGFGGPAGMLGLILAIVLAIILIGAWIILAGSRFVQGGIVERAERVPQLYGYTACLIGLLWALTSAVSLVNHLLDRLDPALATPSEMAWSEPAVTSFEAFRATYDRSQIQYSAGGATSTPAAAIPEPELRRRYEALRADRIAKVEYNTRKGIVTSLFGLVIGSGLFLFHWRWLRRRGVDLESVGRTATAMTPPHGSG